MQGTFEFPADRLIIVNPSIFSIDEANMVINNTNKTVSVTVILTDSAGSKMCPVNAFMDMPRDADTWDDCDLTGIVTKRLETFKTK